MACIDTDTLNSTLLQYAPLKATMALLAATDVAVTLWLNEHLGPLEIQSQNWEPP